MGLSRDIKDWFTKRINGVLDERIAEAETDIDQKKVERLAYELYCSRAGIKNLPELYQVAKQKKDDAEDELRELGDKIYDSAKSNRVPISGFQGRYYYDDVLGEVKKQAVALLRKEVTKELYPKISEEVERINHIKTDVEGVVLLATTETTLAKRLTAVLEKYGGEIDELKQFIPT